MRNKQRSTAFPRHQKNVGWGTNNEAQHSLGIKRMWDEEQTTKHSLPEASKECGMRNKQRSTVFPRLQKNVGWEINNEAQPSRGIKRMWDEEQTTKHSIPEAPKECWMRNKQRSTAFPRHQKNVGWGTNNEAQHSRGTKRLWYEEQTTKPSIPEAPKDCGMRNKQRSIAYPRHQKNVGWETNNEAQPSRGTKRMWDEKQTTKHSIPEAPKDCGMRNKQRSIAYPRHQKNVGWGTNTDKSNGIYETIKRNCLE